MQFTCPVSALLDGLQIATKALSARTPNPILEGVLVETDEDTVILTCSDERITIVTRIEASIAKHGRGVVPGKLFNEIIRRLPAGDVTVTMNDRFIFNIRSAASRMTSPVRTPTCSRCCPRWTTPARSPCPRTS